VLGTSAHNEPDLDFGDATSDPESSLPPRSRLKRR
jgi:hypothetical protein